MVDLKGDVIARAAPSELLTAEELRRVERLKVAISLAEHEDRDLVVETPLLRKLIAAAEERERLRTAKLVCGFCLQSFGSGVVLGEASVTMAAHIATCEKHPMRACVLENGRLRAELAGLKRIHDFKCEEAKFQIDNIMKENERLRAEIEELRKRPRWGRTYVNVVPPIPADHEG